ncbi:MAG: hypothetical protein B7X01_03035, partial [Acidiphilium sp. 21-62-4]
MPNTQLKINDINGQLVVLSVNGRPATDPDLVGRFTLTRDGKVKENGEVDVLYRNLGNWKFEDITATAGVGCTNLACTGATFADIDGNGTLDLIVNTVGNGTLIFFNDGKGRFTQQNPQAPLNY